MQNRLTHLLITAALSLATASFARADSTEARCDIYPAVSDRASASIACAFARYQGNVYTERGDGVSYHLRPTGEAPGNFVDQSGHTGYRQSGLGSAGLIFRMPAESVYVYWDPSTLRQPGGSAGIRDPLAAA